jgi:predicted permease
MLASLRVDVRSAWRSLRAAAGTTAAAMATLGLGIGASVAVLTIAYTAIWRPLPLTDVEQLVVLSTGLATDTSLAGSMRAADLTRWRDGLRSVSGLAGWSTGELTVRGTRAPEIVQAAVVTDNFFAVVGAHAAAGRLFDDPSGGRDLVVLSHQFASRSPQTDPLLDSLIIDGLSLRVAGILPPRFPLPPRADLWLSDSSLDALGVDRFSRLRGYRVVGRLRPGVTLAQAREDATRVLREIEVERGRAGELRVTLQPLEDLLTGDSRPVLTAFVVAAALLLLVACANVATLLVSRAYGRQREFAVRLAIGASPLRLLRTSVIESVILTGAGTVIGVALASFALSTLPAVVPELLPPAAFVALAIPTIAAACAVAFLASTLAGLAPALAAARSDFGPAFRTASIAGSPGRRRLRSALVVAQVAMAVTLLVGAGLLARTVAHLLTTDLGIDASRVTTFRLRMTERSRFDATSREPFLRELVRRTRQLPGVAAAGVGSNLPPSTAPVAFSIRVVQDDRAETRTFDLGSASPGYFDAIGARLVRGRWFEPRDESGPPIAVLSEMAARHLQGLGDPVGRPLPFAIPTPAGERARPLVVGVIEDIRHHGLDRPAHGGIYLLWSQLPAGITYLAVRSQGPAEAIGPPVLRLLRELDPRLPLPEPRTVAQEMHRAILDREIRVLLVGTFAAIAALLAAGGLSAALGRSVRERRREMAVRAALGASPTRTVRLVLGDGLALASIGLTIGLGLAAALGRTAATLLYGVSPYDAMTFAVVAIGVGMVSVAAAWWPARRAARISPLELLRSDM